MSIPDSEEFLLLGKAAQTLKEATLMLENGYYNAAVNRIYYACFYAVKALLVSRDINAHRHSGVKQMLGLHFVKTGAITEEEGRFYANVFEMRQEGDYEYYVEFERDEVADLLPEAFKFIKRIEQILSQ